MKHVAHGTPPNQATLSIILEECPRYVHVLLRINLNQRTRKSICNEVYVSPGTTQLQEYSREPSYYARLPGVSNLHRIVSGSHFILQHSSLGAHDVISLLLTTMQPKPIERPPLRPPAQDTRIPALHKPRAQPQTVLTSRCASVAASYLPNQVPRHKRRCGVQNALWSCVCLNTPASSLSCAACHFSALAALAYYRCRANN